MDGVPIDLRSDTVTLPTAEMRQAIFDARLGDDVFGEDPTTKRLEELAADRLGKEAGLFVPSGTMANLIAVLTHCGRGEEVILGDRCHTFRYEGGGIAALGGVHPFQVRNQADGTMDLGEIEAAVRPDDQHFPKTRLLCLENTHNRCGGAVLTPEYTASVAGLARAHGLSLHIDGARLFNAVVALGLAARELAKEADSVSICLSKGLAAPVGSILCGTKDFIARAHRIRKVVGGGLRQSGVIAAAGIVALESMVERLGDDHAKARRLAEGIATIDGLNIDPSAVVTNMVYFQLREGGCGAQSLVDRLAAMNIKCLAIGEAEIRMVTHCGIEEGDVDRVLDAVRKVLRLDD